MKHSLSFFDVNGRFGPASTGQTEYRTASKLISQLDALGVTRTLAWHIASKEVSPNLGNQTLLREIERTPGVSQRIIPAFVIGTCTLWERGAVNALKEAMERHQVHALRLFPYELNHTLREIEPLVEELLAFSPTLLIDHRSLPPTEDISAFAARFPETPIIYSNVAWSQLTTALDLLRRHDNVLLDTSWLHTCGTLELIVREFGEHRAVFGLGHRTNHGGSLIDLVAANISDEAKAQIASGNLERVLGLTPSMNPVSVHQKGLLWDDLLEGRPLPIEIIDAHAHLGPMPKWMVSEQRIDGQIADLLPRMDRLGIQKLIVSGTEAIFGDPLEGNLLLEESTARHRDRFLGYFAFNPRFAEELSPQLDVFFSRDFFVGFKIINSYWQVPVTDARHDPLWQYANAHALPILLHTWDDAFDFPAMLDEIVYRYPDAIFILGHSGGLDRGRNAALQLALKYPNVYLEWCGSYRMTLPYEELIEKLGPSRFLYGSDTALHSMAWELGRFLSLDLPEASLIPALGENMRNILLKRR